MATKVLMVESFPALKAAGGATFCLYELATGLPRERFTPVVAFLRPNLFAARLTDAGVRVIELHRGMPKVLPGETVSLPSKPLRDRVPGLMGLVQRFKWLPRPGQVKALMRVVRDEGVGLVHVNSAPLHGSSAIVAGHLTGVPVVCHSHEIPAERANGPARLLTGMVARIVCVSNAVRDGYLKLGVPQEKLVVVYNSIDPASFKPVRTREEVLGELDLPAGTFLLGSFANFAPWKGQAVIAEALGLLKDKIPGLGCVFLGDHVGERGLGYRLAVEEKVRSLGLAGSVRFVGYRDDVASYMGACDAVIHSSVRPEPFGRVIIEAMSLGLPCVAADAGGAAEIIGHEETGLLYGPGNANALAGAILRLLLDKGLSSLLAEKGRQRALGDFTRDRYVRGIAGAYDSALASSSVQAMAGQKKPCS